MTAIETSMTCWQTVINSSGGYIDNLGTEIAYPILPQEYVLEICDTAIGLLNHIPNVVIKSNPMYIVGDIHGSIADLLRIFIKNGLPPQSEYIFLGNYVDYGHFSLEVVVLLLTLYVIYPNKITLLRGNHEFERINRFSELYGTCKSVYSSDTVFYKINEVFSYLPLAAVLNNNIFCVHGGFGPLIDVIDTINLISKPLQVDSMPMLQDLLYSNPKTSITMYKKSEKGKGIDFGSNAFQGFQQRTGITFLIRGRQCSQTGVKFHKIKNIISVFSHSNYKETQNKSGVVFVGFKKEIQSRSYPPLTNYVRSEVSFMTVIMKKSSFLPRLQPKKQIQVSSSSSLLKTLKPTDGSNSPSLLIGYPLNDSSFYQPQPQYKVPRKRIMQHASVCNNLFLRT